MLARSYELVRTDILRKTADANFVMLKHALGSSIQFAKLFGILTTSDASVISTKFLYTVTNLAGLLGNNKGWSGAQLINKMKRDTGIDIKVSDNRCHCTLKYGGPKVNKYSDEAVAMLQLVRDSKGYECQP